MTQSESNNYVPVSRELVLTGILPWAGRKYEDRMKGLIRSHPYDPLVMMVPERLLDVYRDHPPANAHITPAQAQRLGLEHPRAEAPNSFMNKLRRALGGTA